LWTEFMYLSICYSSGLVLFTKYYQVDQIKEYEIDGACSMHGWDENAYKL